MDPRIIAFFSHHTLLCIIFIALVILVIANEYITKKQGPRLLSTAEAVDEMNHNKATIIDLRDKDSFQAGHILGARSLNADDLYQQSQYKNDTLILVCARGLQTPAIATKLRKLGFVKPMVLSGGMQAWTSANLPLVKGKK